MRDILFLRDKGCELDMELYDLLFRDWQVVHTKKNVNLNVSNDEFFTSRIARKMDHDELHELLAFYDKPLHTKIRKNLDSPICSEELFSLLSFEDKIKLSLEETRVIASERFLQGNNFQHAKYKALRQLITSMTKGWFNRFLILNFDLLLFSENETWQKKLLANG